VSLHVDVARRSCWR